MNIRPVMPEDLPFLRKMMYEAARWNPDWPREPIEEVLAEPDACCATTRGGAGAATAASSPRSTGEPVGAAWYRLFEEDKPGYGFVDEKTPELSIAVVPLHRRKGIGEAVLRSCMVQAREEGFQALSLSVAVAQPVADDVPEGGVREGRGVR